MKNKLFACIPVLVICILYSPFLFSQKPVATIDPSVKIYDTLVNPGELLLPIDAFGFAGANGQIAAITLRIETDTSIVAFKWIENVALPGSWAANYNITQNEITIIYNAPMGLGYDIDGKLADMRLLYRGGFQTPLHFKANCEFTNKNLQTIANVQYYDGSIGPLDTLGYIKIDSVRAHTGQDFLIPLTGAGTGFDSLNRMHFRIYYDTTTLLYKGIENGILNEVLITDTLNNLVVDWYDTLGFLNLSSADTLFQLKFSLKHDNSSELAFTPGSVVYNNHRLTATAFYNGFVKIERLLELSVAPEGAGTVSGEGYYTMGQQATLIAVPDTGYTFIHWALGDSILSTDSLFNYIMPDSAVAIVASFADQSFYLTLYANPDNGGVALGEGSYFAGDTVTVNAIPVTGFEFLHWTNSGIIVSTSPQYTFLMPAISDTLTAHFGLAQYTIHAVPNYLEFGIVTGWGVYYYGDTATLTAIPSEGYRFVVWTEEGEPVSYDSLYTFMVENDRSLVGNFQSLYGCTKPVALYATNITLYTALLTWVPTGAETRWNLLWGYDGFDTTSQGILIEGINEPQYLIEGLEYGTWYDFYVKAICDDTTNSGWAGPGRFSTLYVGTDEFPARNNIIVSPNPAYESLTIDYSFSGVAPNSLQVYDVYGKLAYTSNYLSPGKTLLDVSYYKEGIYFIRLSSGNEVFTQKVMVYRK